MMLPQILVNPAKPTEFMLANGEKFSYVGVSDFALFKRELMDSGRIALVEPRLDEWRRLASRGGYGGPIVLRVFRYSHPNNKFGIGDPWSYDFDRITRFTEYCSTRGFYVDWTCGDSNHILVNKDGPTGQQQHLNMTCAALAGVFCFLETSNEPFKNGGLPENGVEPPQWGSYLRDSGHYAESDDWREELNLDFISYHGSRDAQNMSPNPWWLGEMWNSAMYLQKYKKPVVMKEPYRADESESDPKVFGKMALILSVTAGVTFHSSDGRDGDGLKEVQTECAINFFKGVRAALSL